MPANNFTVRHYSEDEPDTLNEHVRDPGDPDGVVEADEQKRWQESHPAPPSTPPATYRRRKLWPTVLVVTVLVAAAALGSYWLGSHAASKQQAKKQAATQAATKKQSKQTATTPTKHYDSSTYALGFDYPQTWTVNDTPAQLTVTSPGLQLTAADGSKTTARVVVAVQNPQTTIAGFPDAGAVASLASSLLTYKQPSTVQRAQTYLSYLSYTSVSELDALYVTGDSGYQQGQTIPLTDVIKGNPLISVKFGSCTDESCGSLKGVSLQTSAWASSQTAKDITNLLESITLTD